jgi:hypothetical protein
MWVVCCPVHLVKVDGTEVVVVVVASDRNRCDFSLSTQRWRQFDDEPARASLRVPQLPAESCEAPGVTIGFHPASGPRAAVGKVLHVSSCALMDSKMNKLLQALQDISQTWTGLPNIIKEVSVRKGNAGYMVNFRTVSSFTEAEAATVLPPRYVEDILSRLPGGCSPSMFCEFSSIVWRVVTARFVWSACTGDDPLSIVLSHHRTSIPTSVSKQIKAMFLDDPVAQRVPLFGLCLPQHKSSVSYHEKLFVFSKNWWNIAEVAWRWSMGRET